MRLSEVLSKDPKRDYSQVQGFLENKNLKLGLQRKIDAGSIALNYYCKVCSDYRTFSSSSSLFCVGVSERVVSIDSVLKCAQCETNVQIWYLIESEDKIFSSSPFVRIMKKSEKLPSAVLIKKDIDERITELLEKARRCHRDECGAGSVVYLRKVFEIITSQVAIVNGIDFKTSKGRRKPFKDLLQEVDSIHSLIPKEFSSNGYRLYSDLSTIIHGDFDEQKSIDKFDSLSRLIIGIIENIKNNNELNRAIHNLGWNDEVTE